MPSKPDENDIYMMLGQIAATQASMVEEIRRIGAKVDNYESSVSALQSRVQAIETDRNTRIPDYEKFVHRVNNYIHEDTIWKSTRDGKTAGVSLSAKILWAGVGMLVAISLSVANQILKPDPSPAHQTVKVEAR